MATFCQVILVLVFSGFEFTKFQSSFRQLCCDSVYYVVVQAALSVSEI